MVHNFRSLFFLILLVGGLVAAVAGCGDRQATTAVEATDVPATVEEEPAGSGRAAVLGVELDHTEVPRYGSLEMKLAVTAAYANPYDAREVTVDGFFRAPSGEEVVVPGFWDGEESWRIRFTPWQEGEWRYRLTVQDGQGAGLPTEGNFTVTPSEHHGWLQVGSRINSDYSSRYFAYHDGTPFYGVGHADALNILVDGFSVEEGVGLFDKMSAAGENFVVWWPLYTNSPLSGSHDNYSTANMAVIDLVVKDAQGKGIFLIFTIWDHPQLRDDTHAWDTGNWLRNGFSKLGDIDSFFTSAEAWAWQGNFYRYVIARWGYSPAIGMWQTVSEINGTNAYEQADSWHNKVNAYFVEHDPYHHPTTASMSGDEDWPEGHQTMEVPQVHVYALEDDAVKSAGIIAGWTELMWQRAEKPNWIGEFGVGGNSYYPELFHNAIWAALAAGAAVTPAEWNSSGFWGQMTPEMLADSGRLARFVADIPLAAWNPAALELRSSDPEVRGWGVAGSQGGLLWVQDFALEGRPIDEVRTAKTIRRGVVIEIGGMEAGSYIVTPYDTWQGIALDTFSVTCTEGATCPLALPDFQADMAFKIERN